MQQPAAAGRVIHTMTTDWSTVIDAHLSRWHASTIRPADVDRAESWVRAAASSMLTVPGAWRAKVVNGSVYVKLLRVRPSWAERASVLRMLLMLANRGPRLPDVDFVYVSSDQDPAPTAGYPDGQQILFLSNAIEPKGRKASVPLPEFTWVGWKRLAPWCTLAASLGREAAGHGWQQRRDRLFFSGSLDNGRWRCVRARHMAP